MLTDASTRPPSARATFYNTSSTSNSFYNDATLNTEHHVFYLVATPHNVLSIFGHKVPQLYTMDRLLLLPECSLCIYMSSIYIPFERATVESLTRNWTMALTQINKQIKKKILLDLSCCALFDPRHEHDDVQNNTNK